MKTTQDKLIALAIVIIGPFVVTSSIEFLPWWLSAPIVLLVAIFWLGTINQISDYVEQKKEEA